MKVKSRSHHDVAHLHPLTNVPTKYQLPTPYSFRNIAREDFQTQGHYGRSKVKSRSHHDVAHLQLLSNVPTKYQLPTPNGFRDIARTRLSNSRSLRQGQRSNQGHTMSLHTYISYPMSLQSINFLHLTVSEIQPGQTVFRRPHTRPPDCPPIRPPWVKTIPRQPLRVVG